MTKKGFFKFSFIMIIFLCFEFMVMSPVYRKNFSRSKHKFYPGSRVPTIDESVLEWKLRLSTDRGFKQDKYDVIYLGDSSCLMGIDPKVIYRKTNLTGLNLGTVGYLSPTGYLKVLQNYLNNYPEPKIVVISLSLYPLAQDEKEILRIGYLTRLESWLKENNATTEQTLDWLALAGNPFSVLPSVKFREQVAGLLISKVVESKKFTFVKRGVYPSDFETRQVLRENDGYIEETFRNKDWVTVPPFKGPMTDFGELGLRRILEYLEKRKIKSHVVLTPLPEIVRSSEAVVGYQKLELGLSKAVSGYEFSSLYRNPFLRFYGNEFFGTQVHLNSHGARRYSTWIADQLL